MLRQISRLNDTPDLNRALLLDEFANRIYQIGRELEAQKSAKSRVSSDSAAGFHAFLGV